MRLRIRFCALTSGKKKGISNRSRSRARAFSWRNFVKTAHYSTVDARLVLIVFKQAERKDTRLFFPKWAFAPFLSS